MGTLLDKLTSNGQSRVNPFAPVEPDKGTGFILPAPKQTPADQMAIIQRDRDRGVTLSQGTIDTVQEQRQSLSKIPFIGKFLTGTGPQGPSTSLYEPGSIQQDLVEKGIVGFLLEGFQKKVNPTRAEVGEQIFSRYEKLADVEPDPDRRLNLAVQDVINNSMKGGPKGELPKNIQDLMNPNIKLTEKEKDALFWTNTIENAFAVLDAPIFVGSTKIPKDALLKFLKGAKEVDEILPRLRMVGLGEDVAKEIAPKIAKSTNELQIAKILEDAKTMATEAAKPSLFARMQDKIATKLTPGRTSRFAEDARQASKIEPQQELDRTVVKRADEVEESGMERFFRSIQGGKSFEEVNADDAVPAFIREDLDTFVTKVGDEYQVFEGKTGQQIGDGGRTVAEAVQKAKNEVESLGNERLNEFITNSPLSPRYTQVVEKAPKEAVKTMPAEFPKGIITADKLRLTDKAAARRLAKLEEMSRTASTVEKFVDNSGITRESLEATVKKQGYKDVEQFFNTNRPKKMSAEEVRARSKEATPQDAPDLSDEYYSLLAEQTDNTGFITDVAKEESEAMADNLRAVFADMKGIDLNDPALKFNEGDLEQMQAHYEFVMDSLMDDPGRALSRYVSRKEGDFLDFKDPNKAKTNSERARIEERNQKVTRAAESAFEGTKWADVFDDPDVIREAIENYRKRRAQAQAIFEDIRKIRNSIRLAKQMDTFVEVNQKKLAAEFLKNRKALANIVEAAERAGFRKGVTKGKEKYERLVEILRNRRTTISGIKFRYDLSPSEIRKATEYAQKQMDDTVTSDPRFMTKDEFGEYIKHMEFAAHDFEMRRNERGMIKAIIEQKELKNTENLREAMQLPKLADMTLEELGRFEKVLEKFKDGDEFLSKRTLEVIDRTALKGARTVRQVQEYLSKEIKRVLGRDVSPSELQNLTAGASDYLRWDTSLAESKPFYGFMVNRAQKHIMEGELSYMRIQERIEKLAAKAKASRKDYNVKKIDALKKELKTTTDPDARVAIKRRLKGLGWRANVKQQFIPTYERLINYLEARGDDKEMWWKTMTKEEQEYATFIRNYYNSAYNYLSYINELHGSRYIDAYFTHVRKGFLEKWSDDGFVAAVKNMWDAQKEDMAIANIIDADTGKILPKSKFFQYTLKRTGEGEVSQNLTQVFLKYAKLLERKKMLDKMVPELDVYTNSLTPKELTQRGLEMDRTMKEFVNHYLNTKRGRKFNYGGIVKQNGPADIGLRVLNTFISMVDLGFNFTAGTTSAIGEQAANFIALGNRGTFKGIKRRLWDTGAKRLFDPSASKILKEAEPFIGRNIWTEIAEIDKPIFEKSMQGLFGMFSQASVEANKIFLLGSLTKEELKAGKISAQRMADLRLEAGRWRDMGSSVKSVLGAGSPGAAWTKYKGWALPILRTNLILMSDTVKTAKSAWAAAKGTSKFESALSKKQIVELGRSIETTAVALMIGNLIMVDDKDDSWAAQWLRKAMRESLTYIGAMDASFWVGTPRALTFIQKLVENGTDIVKMAEYKEDTKWGKEGELKGPENLARQLLPGFIEQLFPGLRPIKYPPSKKKSTTGTKLDSLNKLDKLDGLNKLDKLNKLDSLDKLDSLNSL